jgi:hypothetical protein
MILAYRILESVNRDDDTIRMKVSLKGVEEPNAPIVIANSDDLPDFKPDNHQDYAFTKTDGPRPVVLVNGVEMFLEVLSKDYNISYGGIKKRGELSESVWVFDITGQKANESVDLIVETSLVMIVAWK